MWSADVVIGSTVIVVDVVVAGVDVGEYMGVIAACVCEFVVTVMLVS